MSDKLFSLSFQVETCKSIDQLQEGLNKVMKTCVEPAKRGDSIKPGVERSGTPGSSEHRGKSPRSGREPSQRVSRGFWAIARFARSVSFRSVNLGFRCAPPQGGVPSRAARLGC